MNVSDYANYIGKTVEVLIDNASSAHHPTEARYLKKGDIILIKEVDKGGVLVFDIDPKFSLINGIFGPNTQFIDCQYVKFLNPWAGLVEIESLIK